MKSVSMVSSATKTRVDGCLMAKPMSQHEMRAVAMAEAVMAASHAALRHVKVAHGPLPGPCAKPSRASHNLPCFTTGLTLLSGQPELWPRWSVGQDQSLNQVVDV